LHLLVGFAVQAQGNRRGGAQQQWRQQHRAERGGEQQAIEFIRDQPALLHLRHQRKTELTALGEGQAAAPGGFAVAAPQLDQHRYHAPLDQHQREGQAEDQQTVADEQLQVDQHADTDEKQPQQDVAKRSDIRFDLMAVMAFAQQHAGQEGAEGRRQTQQMGEPGGQQHDHQCKQHKQLRRVGRGDFMEQARQQPATGQQQANKQQHGFTQRQRQRPVPGLIAAAGKHGRQGQ